MKFNAMTTTAAAALLVGAGAFPLTAAAQTETTQTNEADVEVIEAEEGAGQTQTETTQTEEVEVEVMEGERTGETVQEGVQETGETVEQAAEETGQAFEETAEGAGEAIEGTAERAGETADAEVTAEDDLDDAQRQELEQAAAEGRPVPRPEMIMGVQKDGQWLSSDLVGRDVMNPQGESIGDIGAILFSDQGPDGVIIEVGGFLGIGEKDVAVRWNELQVTEEEIVLDATEEQLENAPEFVSLEEKRAQAELQAQQEAAEAEQQAAQQTEGMAPATETEGMMSEPAEGEVEVETVE